MKIIKEFKEFAIKGNMFDMAIGIIIGTSFSKIVASLVDDVVMPLLGIVIGNVNFKELSLVLREEIIQNGVITHESMRLTYGNFIQTFTDFLIIALYIFAVIKIFNRIRTKSEDETNTAETTPKNIELLAEIRDSLKEQKKS